MKSIILCTDFSETAQHAVEYGVQLAPELGMDKIILFHSYFSPKMRPQHSILEVKDDENYNYCIQQLEQQKIHLQHITKLQIPIEIVATELPFLSGLQQLVAHEKAQYIVCSTTGKGKVEKFILGSNALSLTHTAPCAVLMVPQEAIYKPIQKVLVACDLKHVASTLPAQHLKNLLTQLQAELSVLNVAPDGKTASSGDLIPEQYELHRLLDSFNPQYHYTDAAHIASGILSFADEHHIDLLIAIPKSRSFLAALMHHCVSKELARETQRPILFLSGNADVETSSIEAIASI